MSGHLDGPPPGPPDPPYIPGDLGAPSAKEFARRRAGDRHMSDNPYSNASDTMHYELHTAWDEGYAEGFAAGRAAAPDDDDGPFREDLPAILQSVRDGQGTGHYEHPVVPLHIALAAVTRAEAAGRAAATPDGWTPTSDAPDAPGWECELCGGKLDGPGEKCGSAQHGPAGSVVYGRAVPAGSLDVGDEPDERFAPPGDADRVTHGLVPPSVDLRDEDAIRRDERERLSARVYENGWCPTCAHKVDPNARPFLEGDALAAAILVDPAEVLSPEELAEYERCQQSVMDARRSAPMVEGQMIVGAAASPDERLREALREIAESDAVDNALDPHRNVRIAQSALAAVDREAPPVPDPETNT